MNNEIANILTQAQKRQLAAEARSMVREAIRAEMVEEVELIAKKWLKENREWLRDICEIQMKKEVEKAAKKIRIDINIREPY